MPRPDMTPELFRAALREAFDAGRWHGRDEASAFDWGCRPSQSEEAAFADLFEEWNKVDAANILQCAAILAKEPPNA